MPTQLEQACSGNITPAMESAASHENVEAEAVRVSVEKGHAVIPANPAHRNLSPVVVGSEFSTKVNANLGRSPNSSSTEAEVEKMLAAISVGAEFVMDLSVGDDLSSTRLAMLEASNVPLGTVPVYEVFSRAESKIEKLDEALILDVIDQQAQEGVDFMTIHAGLLRDHVDMALSRTMGIVSRGGAILAEWMTVHKSENPFYTCWDDILNICLKHDVTVSLGDGLRPGCLADASDQAQFAELDVLGELVQSCRKKGVQVMVEGPGHVPFNEIQMNMERQQDICDNAPFYVLGPVVTDIAPGYDHITSCIGATQAAYCGAALLCYVTPAEHLCLPTCKDVRDGVVAYKIAAHSADIAKGLKGARDIDDEMSRARYEFDWERQFSLAIDGDAARARYEEGKATQDGESDHCSMCGQDFCAVRTSKRIAQKA